MNIIIKRPPPEHDPLHKIAEQLVATLVTEAIERGYEMKRLEAPDGHIRYFGVQRGEPKGEN